MCVIKCYLTLSYLCIILKKTFNTSDCYSYSLTSVIKFDSFKVPGFMYLKQFTQVNTGIECQNLCLTDPDMFCVSAMYDSSTLICSLSTESSAIYTSTGFVATAGATILQR